MSKRVIWEIDSEQPTALQAALDVWSVYFERGAAACFSVDGLTFDLGEFTADCAMADLVDTVIEHGIDRLVIGEQDDSFVVELHNAAGRYNIGAYDERVDAEEYLESVKQMLCLVTDDDGAIIP